jgi:hypothetical protein
MQPHPHPTRKERPFLPGFKSAGLPGPFSVADEKKNLSEKKWHVCPDGHEDGVQLGNTKENKPNRDEHGHLQYRCLTCNITFSVDDDGRILL